MKKQSSKLETENLNQETNTLHRTLMLGATFMALGASVGIDFDNSFAVPPVGQSTETPSPIIGGTLKAKTADKVHQAMSDFVRGRENPTPTPTLLKALTAEQQKLQIQKDLDNIPKILHPDRETGAQ